MKRIHTSYSNVCLIVKFLGFVSLYPAFPQETSGIFFAAENQPLHEVIDSLINKYNLSIVFQDSYLDGVNIVAECNGCSEEEAMTVLLSLTDLQWTKKNDQYIISPVFKSHNPYQITGYIRDRDSGDFIPHANVHIIHSYIGNVSNENGFFILPGVTIKQCTLQVSYIGYETEKIPVAKHKILGSLVQIDMDAKVLVGKNVTVRGKKLNVMQQGEQISQIAYSPRHVSSLPNLGENDVLRSLQLLPGIQIGNAGSAGLYIRGGTPDQNQIILDGMSLYQMDHFFGFVSSVNADAIKDIQVYKGGFPARFGGRVNSVINLVGRNGDTKKTRFSLYTNQLSSGFSFQQPLFGRGSFLLAYRSTITDKFHTKFYNKIYSFLSSSDGLNVGGTVVSTDTTVYADYTPEFNFSDMNAKITFLHSTKNMLSISFYQSKDGLMERSSFDFMNEIESGYKNVKINEKTGWLNNGISMKMAHQWTNNAYSQLIISKSKYYSDNSSNTNTAWIFQMTANDTIVIQDSVLFTEKNSIGDMSIHLNHQWLFSGHQLESGVSISDFTTLFNVLQQDSISIINKTLNGMYSAMYIQDKIRIADKFQITGGLRLSRFSNNKGWVYLPRITMQYDLNSHSNIRGALGKNIQYMHRFSNDFISSGSKFVWLLSSKNMKPIIANQFISGYQYKQSGYEFNLEVYFNSKKDIANFSRLLFPADSYSNGFVLGGEEISRGIELSIIKTNGLPHGWISYNYGKTKWRFDDLNGGKIFRADHDHEHELKTVVQTHLGPYKLTLSWMAFSGNVFTKKNNLMIYEDELGNVSLEALPGTFNSERLPNAHRLDLSLARKQDIASINIEYGLSIFNVYDNKYISHKRYTFASAEQPILVHDVKIMGFTPTIYFRISR